MGVGVTSTAGTPFTWATADFAWSDPEGGQPWASIAPRAYALTAAEAWTTAERLAKALPALRLADGWRTTEASARTAGKRLAEAWRTAQTYADVAQFHLRIMEAWATAERLAKTLPALQFAEAWRTTGASSRTAGKHAAETLTTAEAFDREVEFLRAFAEGWASLEAYAAQYDLSVSERLELVEFYKRHANGVISDIILAITDMSLDDFQNKAVDYGRAPGFSAFQDFVAADYAYQSAVFRAVMDASTSDRGVITALSLQVDVPDVFDSGTATVPDANPAAGVTVGFNQKFNYAPVVTLAVKGGTSAALTAIPMIVGDPTTAGFTAVLKEPDGTFIAGTLSWAARGA